MSKHYFKQFIAFVLLVLGFQITNAQTVVVTTPLGDTTLNVLALTANWGNVPNGVCGNLVLVDDGTAADSLGCNDLVNGAALAGNIAVAFRGACAFEMKATKAQAAGAIALIVINTATGAVPTGGLGGVDTLNATIPTVLISNADGLSLQSALALGIPLSACMNLPNINFTVSVDMSTQTVDPAGAHVAGDFNNWTPSPMTNAGNGVWTYTTSVVAYTDQKYKFLTGPNFGTDENAPAECGIDDGFGGYNRFYDASNILPLHDTTLSTVCYAKCGSCFSQVTLSVDMSAQTVSADGVHVAGDFQTEAGFASDWDPSTTELTDTDADGVYSVTLTLPADGSTYQYKFINGNTWSGEEAVPSACGVDNGFGGFNRELTTPTDGDQDISAVCFSRCGNCNVAVTFKVDMNQQTVSADGVHVAGDFQAEAGFPSDWDPSTAALTDADGNGVYELTVTLPAGFTFQYKYINGNAWSGEEAVPSACGVDNGFGGFNRQYTTGDFDGDITTVCFAECGFCQTPFACDITAIICDNFESYTVPGTVSSNNSTWWTTWSGAAGTAEEGAVSTSQAASGNQSLLIDGTTAGDDCVLNCGNINGGAVALVWKMFVPSGKKAYYNLQRNVPVGTGSWITGGYFNDNGTGFYLINSDTSHFNYPHDTWFDVTHVIDIDNDTAFYYIDTTLVATNSFHLAENGPGNPAVKTLGGVDFYPLDATYTYYLDNLQLVLLRAVNDLCDTPLNINSLFGGELNVAEVLHSNNLNATTQTTDPVTSCFTDNPAGTNMNGNLNNTVWYTFTGDGALYNIATTICNTDSSLFIYDTQLGVYTGSCGSFTQVGCNDDVSASNYMSSLDIQTEVGTTYYVMIDGWDNTLAGGTAAAMGYFCVEVTKKSVPPPPLRNVTFVVDMTNEILSPNGVHIAGNFQGWDPAASAMTNTVGNVWTYTAMIPQGDTVQYKYINGNAWSGEEAVPSACGVDNGFGGFNRRYIVATAANQSLPRVCFEECDNVCDAGAISEADLINGISLYPNPATDFATLNYSFAEANSLTIKVFNGLGQMVSSDFISNVTNGTHGISVKDFATGIYMVQISNGTHQVTKRLHVER